jgi:DNA-nicking Smr family endonuclease
MSKRVKKLSLDDKKLWRTVTKTVIPYGEKFEFNDVETTQDAEIEKPLKTKAPITRIAAEPYQPPIQRPKSIRKPTELNPIDRPVHKKIAKGRVTIDARIDLHGLTQQIAHRVLYDFLTDAYLCGDRHVLVITGKGTSSGCRVILRQVVPDWFQKSEFKEFVSGYRVSAQHHGGDGALYVRLRKKGTNS